MKKIVLPILLLLLICGLIYLFYQKKTITPGISEKKETTTKSTTNTNDLSIDTCTIPIDINGLYIDSLYNQKEIIKVFGNPSESKYWSEHGVWDIRYQLGKDFSGLRYNDKLGIEYFWLYTPQFKIYNGLITVGEPISKLKTLDCGKLVEYPKNDYTFFTSKNPKKNVFFIKTDDNGIITEILFYKDDDYGFEGDENTEL